MVETGPSNKELNRLAELEDEKAMTKKPKPAKNGWGSKK